MRFLLRVVFSAVAIWLVTLFLPGVQVRPFEPGIWPLVVTLLLVALVFGVINATLGNLIRIVAFPVYLLTLGIVALFVNACLLLIVHWISTAIGFGLFVENFWWGMLGAVCISFLTWLITVLTRPIFGKEKPRER